MKFWLAIAALLFMPADVVATDSNGILPLELAMRAGDYSSISEAAHKDPEVQAVLDVLQRRRMPSRLWSARSAIKLCNTSYRHNPDLLNFCLRLAAGNSLAVGDYWGLRYAARRAGSRIFQDAVGGSSQHSLNDYTKLLEVTGKDLELIPKKGRLSVDGTTSWIASQEWNGVPTIELVVTHKSSRKDIRFIVDTAASRSTLDSVSVEDLSLGANEAVDIKLGATTLRHVKLFKSSTGLNILGLDILRNFSGVHFFKDGIKFYPNDSEPESCQGELLEVSSPLASWARIAVKSKIDGIDTPLILDTGASFGMQLYGVDVSRYSKDSLISQSYMSADGLGDLRGVRKIAELSLPAGTYSVEYLGVDTERYVIPWVLGNRWLRGHSMYLNFDKYCYAFEV